jgi:DNA-binding transcriptional LysR family regulator
MDNTGRLAFQSGMTPRSAASLDPRRLETFRTVARCGQVSTAGRLMNLSQPAVTAQIRQLEAEVGSPLFHRHIKGMRLTDHGRVLLEYAVKVHDLLEEAAERVQGEQAMAGDLLLGASTTAAAYIIPRLLQGFLRGHRPSSVELAVGNTDEVLDWLRNGRISLGLVEGLTRSPGVSLEPYLQDELVAVRPTGAPPPLAAVRKAADLGGVPLIYREQGSGTRAVLERALRGVGLPGQPKAADLVMGDTETIKSCVLAGLGIGFLSRWSIQRELQGRTLEVVPLPDLRIPRHFSWAHGSGGLAGHAASFYRHALDDPPQPPG